MEVWNRVPMSDGHSGCKYQPGSESHKIRNVPKEAAEKLYFEPLSPLFSRREVVKGIPTRTKNNRDMFKDSGVNRLKSTLFTCHKSDKCHSHKKLAD